MGSKQSAGEKYSQGREKYFSGQGAKKMPCCDNCDKGQPVFLIQIYLAYWKVFRTFLLLWSRKFFDLRYKVLHNSSVSAKKRINSFVLLSIFRNFAESNYK